MKHMLLNAALLLCLGLLPNVAGLILHAGVGTNKSHYEERVLLPLPPSIIKEAKWTANDHAENSLNTSEGNLVNALGVVPRYVRFASTSQWTKSVTVVLNTTRPITLDGVSMTVDKSASTDVECGFSGIMIQADTGEGFHEVTASTKTYGEAPNGALSVTVSSDFNVGMPIKFDFHPHAGVKAVKLVLGYVNIKGKRSVSFNHLRLWEMVQGPIVAAAQSSNRVVDNGLCQFHSCSEGYTLIYGNVNQSTVGLNMVAKDARCCAATCSVIECPSGWGAIPGKAAFVRSDNRVPGVSECCQRTCSMFNCRDHEWVPNTDRLNQLINTQDASILKPLCCHQTCGTYTCPDGYATSTATRDVFPAAEQDCCGATCKRFQCPNGYIKNQDKLTTVTKGMATGVAQDVCCVATCKALFLGTGCEAGTIPIEAMSGSTTLTQNNCCHMENEFYISTANWNANDGVENQDAPQAFSALAPILNSNKGYARFRTPNSDYYNITLILNNPCKLGGITMAVGTPPHGTNSLNEGFGGVQIHTITATNSQRLVYEELRMYGNDAASGKFAKRAHYGMGNDHVFQFADPVYEVKKVVLSLYYVNMGSDRHGISLKNIRLYRPESRDVYRAICSNQCPPEWLPKQNPDRCGGDACTHQECCDPREACNQNMCPTSKIIKFAAGDEVHLCKGTKCTEPECCKDRLTCDSHTCHNEMVKKPAYSLPKWCVGDCTDAHCCDPRDTCEASDCLAGQIGYRDATFMCAGSSCTYHECCKGAGTCHAITCAGDTVLKPHHARPNCTSDTCTQEECCADRGQCQNSDCNPATMVLKRQNSPTRCAGAQCTEAECCHPRGTCDASDCPADSYVLKPVFERQLCVDSQCTINECCLPRSQCHAGLCDDLHYLKPPEEQAKRCNADKCSQAECCGSKAVCTPDACGHKTTPKARFPLRCRGEICAEVECCDHRDQCDLKDCPKDMTLKPGNRPLCSGVKCTQAECCVPKGQCQARICGAHEVLKDVHPAFCSDTECTAEECCDQRATCTNHVCQQSTHVLKHPVHTCARSACDSNECCVHRGRCDHNSCDGNHILKRDPPQLCEGQKCTQAECCDARRVCHESDCSSNNVLRPPPQPQCRNGRCTEDECCIARGVCYAGLCTSEYVLKTNPPLCAGHSCSWQECCDARPS